MVGAVLEIDRSDGFISTISLLSSLVPKSENTAVGINGVT